MKTPKILVGPLCGRQIGRVRREITGAQDVRGVTGKAIWAPSTERHFNHQSPKANFMIPLSVGPDSRPRAQQEAPHQWRFTTSLGSASSWKGRLTLQEVGLPDFLK